METRSKSDPLEALFGFLHPDRDQAGEKYEALRQILLKFFEWRGALSPDHLADQTFDRVANKIVEGTQIQNINAYCHKVAQFIFLEWINRQRDHKHEPIEDPASLPLIQPSSEDYFLEEDRLECQRNCLGELPSESRDVIKEYFTGEGRDRVVRREAMASRLGISRTALGNRITRLLNKLRECERNCLKTRLA